MSVSESTTRSAPGTGEGTVYDGAIVFQGEEGIEFGGGLSSTLTGVSGAAEGQVLSVPIPQDQTPGRYSNDGTADTPAVTVNQPRISNFEILNQNDEDISGGSVGENNAGSLTVVAESNYEQAENLELTVENANGLEVTADVVTSGPNPQAEGPDNQAQWTVDLTDQSAGSFNFEVAGADDLDFGAAVQTTTLEVTGDDRVRLDYRSDEVTQGEDVVYEVSGGAAGDYHLVTIGDGDFRSGVSPDEAAQIFRSTGDVAERGVILGSDRSTAAYLEQGEITSGVSTGDINYAYAIVQIDDDDGLGLGSVETKFLDDTSVTTEVSADLTNISARGTSTSGTTAVEPQGGVFDEDEADIDVAEGDVTLESPDETYVTGAEVDVNGSAPAGMDDVAIYARDEGDFEIVRLDGSNTTNVDADGTFTEEDVELSEGTGGGNDILSLPGSYRIGVIDASDADTDGDGTVEESLTTSEFNSGTSSSQSLRVLDTSLNASFQGVIRGEIAVEDADVDVEGSAPGINTVLFVAVDNRGNVVTDQITVEDDSTFSEEDVSVQGLSEGSISLHVYSPGRDGEVGDGDVPGFADDLNGFENYLSEDDGTGEQSLQERSLTGDQVRSAILAETVEDTASDDEIVNQNTRITDGQTSITSVYQEGNQASGINPVAVGETMVISGTTNLQPEDNTITVEVGNEETSIGLASTDEWGSNGEWNVTIDTDDASTGTYTVEADDGDNTVTEEVELVEEVQTATPTEGGTLTETTTSTETATPMTETETETETETGTPTEGGGPGFGAIIAVIALLAAALLAVRREH